MIATISAPKLKGAPDRSSSIASSTSQPTSKENKPSNGALNVQQHIIKNSSKPPSRRQRTEPQRLGQFARRASHPVNHVAPHNITTADDVATLLSPDANLQPAHAPTPSSVFEPDHVTAARVDAMTRCITQQVADMVEDDGLQAEQERATAAAALRGALGGKVRCVYKWPSIPVCILFPYNAIIDVLRQPEIAGMRRATLSPAARRQ